MVSGRERAGAGPQAPCAPAHEPRAGCPRGCPAAQSHSQGRWGSRQGRAQCPPGTPGPGGDRAWGSPHQPDPSAPSALPIPLLCNKASLNLWSPDQWKAAEAPHCSWQCQNQARQGAGLSCWAPVESWGSRRDPGWGGCTVPSPFPCLHPKGLLSPPPCLKLGCWRCPALGGGCHR